MTTATQTRLPATGTWQIDPAHSSVEAVARHLMVSKVRGRFATFSGTVNIAEDLAASTIFVQIDADSIDTGDEQRDGHLASEDFLDVENHPHLTFASREVVDVGDGRYRVPGELTLRGVTQPVELDVDYLGVVTDPWGNEKAGFTATAELDREQFDITWNQALEAGGVLVGKTLEVELDVQLQA